MSADNAAPAQGVCRFEVTVKREWLDYNEHMNVAFYLKAFDDASEGLIACAGMGAAYTRETHNSWVALESHIGFRQEVRLGDSLRIESRVVDHDAKKIHLYQEMFRGSELVATHEQLGVHFDTIARRATAFAPDVLARVAALHEAQRALPRPTALGRAVSMRKRA